MTTTVAVPVADEATVRAFLETISPQAVHALHGVERPGFLQLIFIHHAYRGVTHPRFRIDDVDGMTAAAMTAANAGHNVYIEGRTIAEATPLSERGKIEHTRAVFALVVDSDADKDKAGQVAVEASLTVETSPGNAHLWLFFDKVLTAEQAKPIGDAIRAATGADADTGVITQPYRVPGTPNFVDAKKRRAGASPPRPASWRTRARPGPRTRFAKPSRRCRPSRHRPQPPTGP